MLSHFDRSLGLPVFSLLISAVFLRDLWLRPTLERHITVWNTAAATMVAVAAALVATKGKKLNPVEQYLKKISNNKQDVTTLVTKQVKDFINDRISTPLDLDKHLGNEHIIHYLLNY